MSKIKIIDMGSAETTYTKNNKAPKHTTLKWDGEYDGKNAKLNVSINDNGKKEKKKFTFSNDDLINLIGGPVHESPVDERLINDFLTANSDPFKEQIIMSQPMLQSMSLSRDIPIIVESDMGSFSLPLKNNKTKKYKNNSIKNKKTNKKSRSKGKNKSRSKSK